MNYLRKTLSYLHLVRDKETNDDYRYPPFATKPRLNKPLRIRILGDHSSLHSGCEAVMSALTDECLSRGWEIAKSYRPYDVLIMNGEGSMHSGSKTFHKKMKILEKAVVSKIPAFLVNTVWQNNPHDYDALLGKLNGISVREKYSQKELLDKHGIKTNLSIDASFFARINEGENYSNFNSMPVKTDFYFPSSNSWAKDDGSFFPKVDFLDMSEYSWSGLIKSLKTSSLLITGRHHAVYAACKARVPFIVSDSNTHKISGLFKSAEVNIPLAKNPEELVEHMGNYKNILSEYNKLFDWMESKKRHDVIPELTIS